ncbi:MAG: putative SAM-dependent methyltransferase [Patiriisocius sp.]|jgi:predicted SAM-dependent methyltransferase
MLTKLRRNRWIYIERKRIRKKIESTNNPKIIIGAGTTNYKDWIKSDYPFFDITSDQHWEYLFAKRKANKILCEHVLEHFTPEDNEIILRKVYNHLDINGSIRIAVPDKNHPDKRYIDYVKPGGQGDGSDDHKSFWDHESYSTLLKNIGFDVKLLEYCDKSGEIHQSKYDLKNGIVNRSLSYDFKGNVANYSSLILDAVKVK